MKKLFIFVFSIFLYVQATAQDAATNNAKATGAVIAFAEATHNFGDITQGDKVDHIFKFTNTGTEPLILSNVLTTCGCTATNWPRDPIAPGKSGEITVSFNSAGKMGVQNKVVTVVSNATNSQEKVKIVTNILPKKDS
ncbi:MAG: DUF1573 domain-containing protein [Bacteroidota bacterium]|nr:DUF1573 domain-containing protein [Bacteroidota bacterium]